jgi:hypothetical protein
VDTSLLIQDITNIAIMVSIAFLAYQIYLQRKETEYNRYEKLMNDFSATTSSLLDHIDVLDLTMVGDLRPKKWDKYTEAQKKTCCYYDSLIGLLERVYVGVPHNSPNDDWEPWRIWIENLSNNELFVDTFNNNRKMYGSHFVTEIENIIKETADKRKKK